MPDTAPRANKWFQILLRSMEREKFTVREFTDLGHLIVQAAHLVKTEVDRVQNKSLERLLEQIGDMEVSEILDSACAVPEAGEQGETGGEEGHADGN